MRNVIDGRYLNSSGRSTIDDIDPAPGAIHALVDEATGSDVEDAVEAARRALKAAWARLSPAERARALHRIADEIEARFSDFPSAEIKDTGKPTTLAM
jgi:aminomuconate-semialdehyde/2-hydroxymuconate-6-semialdehyde dehydrogenase